MSEFRIIKCSSCDAALVELKGEKIRKCVQCGHNFLARKKNKNVLKSITTQIEKELSNTSTQGSTPSSTNKTTSKTSNKKLVPKKPKSIIGTIIKWYIILFILSRVFKEFF